jgi:hypothetical protein
VAVESAIDQPTDSAESRSRVSILIIKFNKNLLVRRGALERWYDFSNKSEETALREWCVENGIEISDT